MISFNSPDENMEIGAVFTPMPWAAFAIEQFGLFDKWMSGATICDPTMGGGNLLFALIDYGLRRGYKPAGLPIDRLFGIELNVRHFQSLFIQAKEMFSIKLREENFLNGDIFFIKNDRRFDILFGNPPWQNFVDLPPAYKESTKKLFFKYDLVKNPQTLLLGGSRIDIAALVLHKTIQKNLEDFGEGVFFIPLSLLLSGGAHTEFRSYTVNGINYCIDTVFDFGDLNIFDGVSTRYGLIHFSRDKKQEFPLAYHRWNGAAWEKLSAKPLFTASDPLSVCAVHEEFPQFSYIEAKQCSMPRQGINTCGANDIFFFDGCTAIDKKVCKVTNKTGEALLPKSYIFPVADSANFTESEPVPRKWVLLPYAQNGKPLDKKTLDENPLLAEYLSKNRSRLEARRGTLINTWIRRGIWWALLGVGEYSFYPHKIIWEAYGKNTFKPKLFSGGWQANQSLQAFMPFTDPDEAGKVFARLANGEVEKYLLSLKMEGTMNWAQPGKIKKLIKFKEEYP
jgi:hypothetical protein